MSEQGSAHLNCPSCHTRVPAGTSICPNCDFIIDASFLGGNVPPDDEPDPSEATESGDEAALEDPTEIAQEAEPASSGPPSSGAPSSRSARSVPRATTAGHPAAGAGERENSPAGEFEAALGEFRDFVLAMPWSDRLSFFCLSFTLFFAFLPWKETAAEGEILGLLSAGIFVFVAAGVGLYALVSRRRNSQRPHPALLGLQLGSAAVAILLCLFYIWSADIPSTSRATDGNVLMPTSAPALGAYLGLVASTLAFFGAVVAFRAPENR